MKSQSILTRALLALAFYSCSSSLNVQTNYLSHENLASYHVGTPDPRLFDPPIGQQLIISWSVPKDYLNYEDLHLEATIRFRNRQEVKEVYLLNRRRGTYVYSLVNKDYFETHGILTYKVDLIGGGCILEEWRHQMWVELINLERKEAPQDEQQIPGIEIEDEAGNHLMERLQKS